MCVIQLYLDTPVSSSTQVKIFCFTIATVNKVHGSECIETSTTLACTVWNLEDYVGFTNQYFRFLFYLFKSRKCSQYLFLTYHKL